MESIENIISAYDLILIDFDGTLFDTALYHKKAYELARSKNILKKNLYKFKCKIFLDLVKNNPPKKIKNGHLIYKASKRKNKIIAITSATLYENIKTIIKYANFKIMPDKIYCGTKYSKNNKPNPDMLLDAAKDFKINASKILVIEDSKIGFETAKNANFDCINVNTLKFVYYRK